MRTEARPPVPESQASHLSLRRARAKAKPCLHPYLDVEVREGSVIFPSCPEVQKSHLGTGDTGEGLPQWSTGWGDRAAGGRDPQISDPAPAELRLPMGAPLGAHLVLLRVIKEVGPVGVCLHEVELEQLPQAQDQDAVADLGAGRVLVTSAGPPGGPWIWAGEASLPFPSPSSTPSCLMPRADFEAKRTTRWGNTAALLPALPHRGASGLQGHPVTHLIPDLLAQPLSLVQGEAGHQLRGQHMGAAELVHNLRHIEEGVVLQQLPGRGGLEVTPGPP